MRTHSAIKWVSVAAMTIAVLSVMVFAGQQPVQQPSRPVQQVSRDDAKDFQDRVAKYLAIQKKALGKVPSIPKETADTALISKHQQQVADAIRMLRPNPMQGEIFTPWLKTAISTALKQQVKGKAGADNKETILGEGNPRSAESPSAIKLTINGAYPDKAPLSTVPPSVLMALPVLKEGVEYRFVGHTLILRDTKANIVVDTLPNAF
jgi:hypothetical protein